MTDLTDRLRAADPVPEPIAAPPSEWLIARLEAAGEVASPRRARPARRRRRLRLRVILPVFATALTAAVVVLFARGSSPDVVAEAREALGTPDQIIHTVVRTERISPNGRLRQPGHYLKLGEVSDRSELWTALNPVRTRSITTILPTSGGAPLTLQRDYAGGIYRTAKSWDDRLSVVTLPAKVVATAEAAFTHPTSATEAGWDPVAGVRTLLSEGKLTPAGKTKVGDREVLRFTGVRPKRVRPGGRGTELQVDVEYLVDADTYAPVRITTRLHPLSPTAKTGIETSRISFETYERIPVAGHQALLRIPDAGQRRVVRSR
jgi:hypothetical protein